MKKTFKTKVFLNNSGKGKVKFFEEEILSLSKREMFKVFPGDDVICQKMPGSKAKIKEVLKRNTNELTGIIKKYKGKTFLTSLDKSFHLDILLEGKNLKHFKSNDICEVKITSQPSLKYKPKAKPIKTLKSNDVFEEAFIFATNGTELSTEWSKSVIKECNKIKRDISLQDIDTRRDLRSLNFVTIDGSNAKDFDDAVYAEEISEGYKLFVAIADVSEYVPINTNIDKEAFFRATSVYFDKRVLPMLPEIISNGLCSLRPLEDKLVITCEINLDRKGHIISYDFSQSIINSKQRLTYEEVEKYLKKNTTKIATEILSNIDVLKIIHSLRRKIRKERKAIDFHLSEYYPVESNNKIVKFKESKHLEANEIVEECMILANICAAKFTKTSKAPIPFRHHANPDLHELEKLKEFLKTRGLRKGMEEPDPRKRLNLWLEEIEKSKKSFSLIYQILRSMKLAVYSGKESNHFALGLNEYSHFTSPIRRYSDLITHRVIKNKLEKKQPIYSENDIEDIAAFCSEKDRETDKIVRQSSKYLSCKCAENYIGKVFSAEIISVLEFGMFMHIKDLNIEGFCHVKNLKKSPYYIHDEFSHSLRSPNNNDVYSLGDKCKIKIKSVDTSRKRIDLKLVF
jgi:ribonuclease R